MDDVDASESLSDEKTSKCGKVSFRKEHLKFLINETEEHLEGLQKEMKEHNESIRDIEKRNPRT